MVQLSAWTVKKRTGRVSCTTYRELPAGVVHDPYVP